MGGAEDTSKEDPRDPFRGFVALVLAVLLAALLGWLLSIGKDLLLPMLIAVMAIYVVVAASDAMGRLPVIGRAPEWTRRVMVLGGFLVGVALLLWVVLSTGSQLAERAPLYQKNLRTLADHVAIAAGLGQVPDWEALSARLYAAVDLQKLAVWALGSVSAFLGVTFMVVVYATFLLGERGGFARKIATALPGGSAAQTQAIVRDINQSIGDYLAVKTLINVILAILSYLAMVVMGVDFALFWAVLIGLLNYIPYIGSMLGVVFPVLLTMAQFGSISTTVIVTVLLTAAQAFVGNVLEPKMVGQKVNMSPFVVLVALAFWSAIWGIPGAILAIPMTSIMAIVFAAFAPTRPLAVLLADDVSVFETSSGGPP